MADSAFMTMYRNEFVRGFEQLQSLMRQTVTVEFENRGGSAVFLVADSGGATAVTRGLNGYIPPRPDNLNQFTATLREWHDLPQKSGFNIFASQGDQKKIMQMTSFGVLNRKIDDDIIAELNTGTVDTGAALPASIDMIVKSKAILGLAQVPFDGNIWGVITPAFEAYMLKTKEFSATNYVERKPLSTGETAWNDMQGYYNFAGVKWFVHPRLPGAGTNAEKCFMYHRSAVGHAVDSATIQAFAGYDERQDFSWARHSAFMGSKLLQNAGIVVMNHDGSALVGQ